LFRDCAATSLAVHDPDQVQIAHHILGNSYAMMEKHYNLARMTDAARHYHAALEQIRDGQPAHSARRGGHRMPGSRERVAGLGRRWVTARRQQLKSGVAHDDPTTLQRQPGHDHGNDQIGPAGTCPKLLTDDVPTCPNGSPAKPASYSAS
jgi:hypothetical protein